MASPLLLGIDAGTTGIRALVFTPAGEVIAQAGRALPAAPGLGAARPARPLAGGVRRLT